MMLRLTVASLARATACLLATALRTPAQPPVRIVGAVQWVSTMRMAVMTERGDSIMVDVMPAEQSTYRALRTGDWVMTGGG